MDSLRLEGKVAIVTGAAPRGEGLGIGKATAILFSWLGAKVVLVNRTEAKAQALQRQIENEGGTCSIVVADVTEPVQVEMMANTAVFLASDESRWVTGTSLLVDGGLVVVKDRH